MQPVHAKLSRVGQGLSCFKLVLASVDANMPPKINFELKGRILAHWSEGYSHSKIVKKLSENGTPVFLIIVRRVIFRQKDKENGLTTPVKKLPDHMKPR